MGKPMPVRTLNNTTQGATGAGILNPGVAGRQEIVPRGNIFNGISILEIPTGLELYLQFGNNPRLGPIRSPLAITLTDVPLSDVAEGVFAEVDVAVPNSAVVGWVSYARPGERQVNGGVSAMGT